MFNIVVLAVFVRDVDFGECERDNVRYVILLMVKVRVDMLMYEGDGDDDDESEIVFREIMV